MALRLKPIGRQQSVCLLLLPLQLLNDDILARPVLPPAQLLQVHLVRTVRNAERADQSPQIGQGRVLADTGGAVGLDSAVDDRQSHLGNEDLGLRDLLERALGVAVIDLDRGVEDDEPRGVDLDPGLGDPLEDDAVRGQGLAEGFLALVVDAGHEPLERLLGRADGAHRVVDATRAQTALDDLEPAALAQHDVGHGHADVVEADVAVAVGRVVVPVHREHPVHGDARGVCRDEDDGLSPVRVGMGRVRLAHHDVELAPGVAGARGPPFLGISVRD